MPMLVFAKKMEQRAAGQAANLLKDVVTNSAPVREGHASCIIFSVVEQFPCILAVTTTVSNVRSSVIIEMRDCVCIAIAVFVCVCPHIHM